MASDIAGCCRGDAAGHGLPCEQIVQLAPGRGQTAEIQLTQRFSTVGQALSLNMLLHGNHGTSELPFVTP